MLDFKAKCTKFDFGCMGLRPRPHWRSLQLQCSPKPLSEFKGACRYRGSGACPPCWRLGNWSLICTKFGHLIELILRKIIKIVATRCQILRLKCTKFDFGWGSAPDPHLAPGELYLTPLQCIARPWFFCATENTHLLTYIFAIVSFHFFCAVRYFLSRPLWAAVCGERQRPRASPECVHRCGLDGRPGGPRCGIHS